MLLWSSKDVGAGPMFRLVPVWGTSRNIVPSLGNTLMDQAAEESCFAILLFNSVCFSQLSTHIIKVMNTYCFSKNRMEKLIYLVS